MKNYRNPRAIEIWDHITSYVDFTGKTVVDLGCGYGDFSILAHMSGASYITAYDNDEFNIKSMKSRLNNIPVVVRLDNIEKCPLNNADIGMCLSVLPYLKDPDLLLRRMSTRCNTVLIECQYNGDYDGFHYIRDDNDMSMWLSSAGFNHIEMIGKTKIEHIDVERSIWLCSVQKQNTSSI